MTIIADSGSTKTDWRIIDAAKKISHISTIGFNPVLTDTNLIINELRPVFFNKKQNNSIKNIYYYGAGCWDKSSCIVIENALSFFFPKANIEVTNDLLGAARAVCGYQSGIACILGTGANSCLFDGKRIIDNVPALGYIIGDEGSGAFLGKQLIQHYFYRELPNDLKVKLDKEQTISKDILIKKVYQDNQGNRYLANFAKFLIQEKKHPFVIDIVKESFNFFIKKQVLKYENVMDLPIHFIGSIAYFLKEILEECIEENGLKLGKVLRQPIDGLLDFHSY